MVKTILQGGPVQWGWITDRVVERDLSVVLGLFRDSESLSAEELAELERLVADDADAAARKERS